ncbi:MAG: HEAT repeat domain-containing protein [Planctomycetaceae bacterium]
MFTSSILRRELSGTLFVVVAASVCADACFAQNAAVTAGPETAVGFATKSVRIEDVSLTVPAGIHVTKIAGEPLVTWPVVADWDQQGRLVVVESGGVSRPIAEHNEKRLHRVVRLVDEDGDGTFDSRILAADQLPFAEGVLCVGNSLLVSAPPQIFRLIDNDNDGVCEQREIWYDAGTITGCANDLHGPYEGRDGWIYWCKGAFAEQTHELPGGRKLVSSAAHMFRRRLEGGPVEPVMTGGMDNPVEAAFLPSGERFFTSTFLQHPRDGARDGVAHAVYGGVYGKDHDVINGHLRTGDLMPITVQFAAAAPAGLAYLESPRVASLVYSDPVNVLVAAQFNLHRVSLHSLTPDGAGFRSENRDLLVADRIDFHPTEVIEDADGSLIVIDTGGWYDLCCPSSHVDQKTAAGGIYRLSPESTPATAATRRSSPAANAPIDRLVADISSVDSIARRAATAELIRRADESTPALTKHMISSEVEVRHRTDALWALCRIGSPAALEAITGVLNDQAAPDSLASAAAHAVSVNRWKAAVEPLQRLVVSQQSPQVRRAAAEALGRVGSHESIEPLMQAIASVRDDRILEHSLLYALMELEQTDTVREYLTAGDSLQRRAAMIVLDQTRPDLLSLSETFAAAQSDDDALRKTALDILKSHPPASPSPEILRQIQSAWENTAESLEIRDQRTDAYAREAELLATVVAGWSTQLDVQSMIAGWITAAPQRTKFQQQLLVALLDAFPENELPASWPDPVANWLQETDWDIAYQIAEWLADHPQGLKPDSGLSRSLVRVRKNKPLTLHILCRSYSCLHCRHGRQ